MLTDQTHRELSRIGRNYVFESGTRLVAAAASCDRGRQFVGIVEGFFFSASAV